MSWNPPLSGIFINTLKPTQDDRRFEDDILVIVLNEKFHILIQISKKFVSEDQIDIT